MSKRDRPPTGFLRSFAHAFRGLRTLFQTQRNVRIHAAAGIATLIFGWVLQIRPAEWIAILVCIGLVLAAEAFNSALERLADRLDPNPDPHIRDAKNLAAGAVLIASLIAAIVGAIVFFPKVATLLSDGAH